MCCRNNSLIPFIWARRVSDSKMLAPPRQQSYAPTAYSYMPSQLLSSNINLDEVWLLAPFGAKANLDTTQAVRLSGSATEQDLYDSLAEIYSIIVTLDGLEKAYIKDSISEAEYTEICSRLLKQYKSNLSDENVAREFVDLETFKREWRVRVVSTFHLKVQSFSLTHALRTKPWLRIPRSNAPVPPNDSVLASRPQLPTLPHILQQQLMHLVTHILSLPGPLVPRSFWLQRIS